MNVPEGVGCKSTAQEIWLPVKEHGGDVQKAGSVNTPGGVVLAVFVACPCSFWPSAERPGLPKLVGGRYTLARLLAREPSDDMLSSTTCRST